MYILELLSYFFIVLIANFAFPVFIRFRVMKKRIFTKSQLTGIAFANALVIMVIFIAIRNALGITRIGWEAAVMSFFVSRYILIDDKSTKETVEENEDISICGTSFDRNFQATLDEGKLNNPTRESPYDTQITVENSDYEEALKATKSLVKTNDDEKIICCFAGIAYLIECNSYKSGFEWLSDKEGTSADMLKTFYATQRSISAEIENLKRGGLSLPFDTIAYITAKIVAEKAFVQNAETELPETIDMLKSFYLKSVENTEKSNSVPKQWDDLNAKAINERITTEKIEEKTERDISQNRTLLIVTLVLVLLFGAAYALNKIQELETKIDDLEYQLTYYGGDVFTIDGYGNYYYTYEEMMNIKGDKDIFYNRWISAEAAQANGFVKG